MGGWLDGWMDGYRSVTHRQLEWVKAVIHVALHTRTGQPLASSSCSRPSGSAGRSGHFSSRAQEAMRGAARAGCCLGHPQEVYFHGPFSRGLGGFKIVMI